MHVACVQIKFNGNVIKALKINKLLHSYIGVTIWKLSALYILISPVIVAIFGLL